ncbi:MAG: hypothetical protein M3537_09330 [Chloroflexota bacterium]|nr:hypothetical protein [Chloroflexota bacterium]
MLCDPWITAEDLVGCDCDTAALDEGKLEGFIDAASEVLYLMSGAQFSGTCTETLRPCWSGSTWSLPRPAVINGTWYNLGCGCGSADSCSCGAASSLMLPFDHPTAVTEVKIDGAAFTAFRLHGRRLYRAGSWPCCNDLSQEDTESGTWSVTVEYGLAPPASGRLAARALVTELVRACNGDVCRLPAGATNVVRQGVSIDIEQFSTALLEDQTGLTEVDLFLRAVNPKGLRRRGRFWSPDVPAALG